jgi:hypothetical protein
MGGNAVSEFREGAENFGLFSRFAAPVAAGGGSQWSAEAIAGTVLAAAPAVAAGGAGLSLAMTLPVVGEDALAFSKVGGSPRLVLKARSAEAQRTAWGIGEIAMAALIAIILLSAARSSAGLTRTLAIILAIAAAAAFLFLPNPGSWIALSLFAVALITLALRRQTHTEPVVTA